MRGAAMRAAAVMLLLHCLGQAAEGGKGVPADLGSVEGVDLGAAQRDQRGFGGMGGGLATKGSFAMMGGGGWEEDRSLGDASEMPMDRSLVDPTEQVLGDSAPSMPAALKGSDKAAFLAGFRAGLVH